jgi:hypothetical protein
VTCGASERGASWYVCAPLRRGGPPTSAYHDAAEAEGAVRLAADRRRSGGGALIMTLELHLKPKDGVESVMRMESNQ